METIITESPRAARLRDFDDGPITGATIVHLPAACSRFDRDEGIHWEYDNPVAIKLYRDGSLALKDREGVIFLCDEQVAVFKQLLAML